MPRSSTISAPTPSIRWSSLWRSKRSSGSKSPTRTPKRSRASRKPSTTSRRTRRPKNRGGDLNRRVVVTGIGLVSALGIGTKETWAGLLAGQSGVGRVTRFDATAYAAQIAAEVKGFEPLTWIEKKDIKKMDLFIQYAIAASQFAVDDAALAITPENAADIGVFIGSGIGGFITIEREHEALLNGGPRK